MLRCLNHFSWFCSLHLTWQVLIALTALVVTLCAVNRSSRSWVVKGAGQLTQKKVLFSVLAVEFAVIFVTCAPYWVIGGKKDLVDYVAFAFPCLAGIVAGGSVFFDGKKEMDLNSWSAFVSAGFIAVGYFVLIWSSSFTRAILFLDLLIVIAASSAGLFVLGLNKNYEDHQVDGFFMPMVVLFGVAVVIFGFVFSATYKP